MEELQKQLTKHAAELRREIRKKTLSYMVAGFALVAGLAWNEAIRALIEEIFPAPKNTIIAKFIYAVIITVFIVVFGSFIARLMTKNGEETKSEEDLL